MTVLDNNNTNERDGDHATAGTQRMNVEPLNFDVISELVMKISTAWTDHDKIRDCSK